MRADPQNGGASVGGLKGKRRDRGRGNRSRNNQNSSPAKPNIKLPVVLRCAYCRRYPPRTCIYLPRSSLLWMPPTLVYTRYLVCSYSLLVPGSIRTLAGYEKTLKLQLGSYGAGRRKGSNLSASAPGGTRGPSRWPRRNRAGTIYTSPAPAWRRLGCMRRTRPVH